MRAILFIIVGWILAISLPVAAAAWKGSVVSIKLVGSGLNDNLNGDDPVRVVKVYLPPRYAEVRTRYPVVYLLHGYKGTSGQWVDDPSWNIQDEMDKSIASGGAPMIIVMPDANTKAGGSFYTNSIADGQWEDFITEDLVHEIDTHFRTIASARARGISGHSMGGYGALRLAFRHPDVFSTVYALSPCCLAFAGDLSTTSETWQTVAGFKDFAVFSDPNNYLAQALLGMAIAWSPDPAATPFHADLPAIWDGRKLSNRPIVIARWNAQMIVPNVRAQTRRIHRLRAIAFDAGRSDQFTHIPLGEQQLHEALTAIGVRHRFEIYEGDHNSGVPARISAKMLPFFEQTLTRAQP